MSLPRSKVLFELAAPTSRSGFLDLLTVLSVLVIAAYFIHLI